MKRREFLKGVMGAGALVAVPSLVSADISNQFKPVQTIPDGGVLSNFDIMHQGSEARLLQEGINAIADIEYEELSFPEAKGDLSMASLEQALIDIKRFEDEKGLTIDILGGTTTSKDTYVS